jgi:putative membrane protein
MKQILSQNELGRLATVIGEVEKATAGEIRLMIVKRSSLTSHVHLLLWNILISLSFIALWFFRHDLIFFESWGLWAGLIGGSYAVSLLLSRFALVQRRLTNPRDLHHQVWARAEVEFHREGLSDTTSHTGVLIFVSLFEHMALVLADKGVADKVDEHAWDKVVDEILHGARNQTWAESLEKAVRECGKYLSEHFPPQAGKGNELSNAVILKD